MDIIELRMKWPLFWCLVFGHNWRETDRRYPHDEDSITLKCNRCGKEESGRYAGSSRPDLKEVLMRVVAYHGHQVAW